VSTVYTVDSNNVVDLHTVTLGPQYGQDVIVTSGLSRGDRVITQGSQKVQPGTKVTVQVAAAGSAAAP
jgi:multidrug efflux system membrane fusion protein